MRGRGLLALASLLSGSLRAGGAWADGVTGARIWNNIVISKGRSTTACQNRRQELASALAYMDHDVYDAAPVYNFGEYTSNRRRGKSETGDLALPGRRPGTSPRG